MSKTAVPTIQVDNARTRVTEWRFAPGAETGFHRHETDYAVVPQTSGRLKIFDADGIESFAELTAGSSYFRNAGVAHNVINASKHEIVFIDVEFK